MISDTEVKRLASQHCTIEQAAMIAGCNPRTLRRAIDAKKLTAYKIGGIVIYISDLNSWIATKLVGKPRSTRRRVGRDVHG